MIFWLHRVSVSASASALTVVSILSMIENGYDADTWSRLHRCKLMWAMTNINADADADAW